MKFRRNEREEAKHERRNRAVERSSVSAGVYLAGMTSQKEINIWELNYYTKYYIYIYLFVIAQLVPTVVHPCGVTKAHFTQETASP